MRQSTLRITIFSMWLSSMLFGIVLLLVGPVVRAPGVLLHEQVFAVLPTVVGLHFPALSCFGALWFPAEERQRAKAASLHGERAFGAIALTIAYLLIVAIMLVWPTYVVGYDTPSLSLPAGGSFADRINDAVKVALMISPLALAPVAFATRVPPNK